MEFSLKLPHTFCGPPVVLTQAYSPTKFPFVDFTFQLTCAVICGPGGLTPLLPAPSSNQQQAPQMVLQQLPAQQLFTIVNAASRMHINACSALRSQHNLECSYVCCAYHNTYDPGKSPGNSTSLGTCTQGPIYQGNLERILYLTQYLYKTGSDLSCAGRCVHTLGMRIWTQSDK